MFARPKELLSTVPTFADLCCDCLRRMPAASVAKAVVCTNWEYLGQVYNLRQRYVYVTSRTCNSLVSTACRVPLRDLTGSLCQPRHPKVSSTDSKKESLSKPRSKPSQPAGVFLATEVGTKIGKDIEAAAHAVGGTSSRVVSL